jgi:hypothetical protein
MADIITPVGIDDELIGTLLFATIQLNNLPLGGVGTPVLQNAINMNGNQKATVFATPFHGLISACVIGVPVWSTSDPSLVKLSPSADGLSCVIFALGQSGSCQVFWKGQGAGGTITGSVNINVTSVLADNVVMTLGSPKNACC